MFQNILNVGVTGLHYWEKKRILYITSVDLGLERGPGINEREFALALDKECGSRVHYIIPKPAKEIEDLRVISGRIFYCVRINYYNPLSLLMHVITMVWMHSRLQKLYKYDLIVFRLDLFPFGPYLVTRTTKTPFVIKTLEYFDYFRSQKGVKGFIGRLSHPFINHFHHYLASKAMAIDACTTSFITFFKKRLNLDDNKLFYIDNAVNTDRFRPIDLNEARCKSGLTKFDPIIGFVGGRPFERGGLQMIEAASLLLKSYNNLGIVIVGGSEREISLLYEHALALGVSHHCVIMGKIAYIDVVYYVNSFDVCISFDLMDRTVLFGNSSQKIRQYIACGKPVVIGEGGNEFVEREGLGSIVLANNKKDIAGALQSWLGLNAVERKAHAAKASSYARQNLSVEKTVKERLDLWSEKLKMK